jgi:hypothetical protein
MGRLVCACIYSVSERWLTCLAQDLGNHIGVFNHTLVWRVSEALLFLFSMMGCAYGYMYDSHATYGGYH